MPKFKAGDLVRVVRSFPDDAAGWMSEMEACCIGDGKSYRVGRNPANRNVFVETGGRPGLGWWFPPAALELVPKAYGNEEDA